MLCIFLGLLVCLAFLESTASGPTNIIPNKYIVTLRNGISSDDKEEHITWVNGIQARSLEYHDLAGIERNYSIANFQAYAGAFNKATIARVKNSPDVAAIEPDQMTYTTRLTIQRNAPSWGLGAISHRQGAGSSDYIFESPDRKNTLAFAYVIDSGINDAHKDFEGRANLAWSFDDTEGDGTGHGTHVAGIIAGHRYGVAKSAEIIAVKVFGNHGQSPWSTVLAGYNWAVEDIWAHEGRKHVSAISMSIGGPVSAAVNEAIENAFNGGILTVVAAGNDHSDAENISPASSLHALTVGSINSANELASYSNFGASVNIFAPGSDIVSAGSRSLIDEQQQSGTSMACPHVTGLALYLMTLKYYESPRDVWNHLLHLASQDKIKGVPHGTTNLMANNGNGV